MANYPVNKIRNVCLMGHGGDGKTSLVESLLNIAGVTDRVGKIADGNTVCDFDPEEIKRKFSISTAVAPVEWNGWRLTVMTDMFNKYFPYAVIILLVYMLLPLVFIPGAMQKFSPHSHLNSGKSPYIFILFFFMSDVNGFIR